MRICLSSVTLALALAFLTAPAFAAEPAETGSNAATGSSATGAPTRRELPRQVSLVTFPDARLELSQTTKLPVGRSGEKIPVQMLNVQSGRVDALLPGKAQERGVFLQAPNQIAAISTGGSLSLVVTSDFVVVHNASGEALVGVEGRFRPLPTGAIRKIDRRSGSAEDTTALPAPQLSVASKLQLSLEGPSEIALGLGSTPGASSHRVSLYEASSPSTSISETLVATGTRASVRVPAAGSYFVIARAIDAFGLDGKPSEPLPLRVVGLAPGQDAAREGGLHLEPGQSARLVGVEGLVMRYGRSTEYVQAVGIVGLPGQKPTTVEYRDPKDPSQAVVIPIVPRLFKAQITMGPSNVAWPEVPVRIQIDLKDGSGVPLEDVASFSPEVTVNRVPVELDWSRSRGSLDATLEPQPGPGPWVVRVSVKNARGVEVARNLLEVIEGDKPVTRQAQR